MSRRIVRSWHRRGVTVQTLKVRCNQNRIFGCGRLAEIPASIVAVGENLRMVLATGRCTCGLPLADYREALDATAALDELVPADQLADLNA